MALACLLYIHRVSETTTVSTVTQSYVESGKLHSLQEHDIPDYVSILRIHGPFLFGTTGKLMEETHDLDRFGPIVILRLRNMNAIDATGVHELEKLAARLKRSGRTLLLCGARPQPRKFLRRADFLEHIGARNIQPHVQAALARAAELHAEGAERKPSA